jgi:UDP-N-acetylglucosamine 1-carboxyvinyltransferase
MYRVVGGPPLAGSVRVSGAKNAALPAMAAALLTDEEVVLRNVPEIDDTRTLSRLLDYLGVKVSRPEAGVLVLRADGLHTTTCPTDLVATNRASFAVVGPLLGRFQEASSTTPGGDVIGQRPVDIHLTGFVSLGAEVDFSADPLVVRAPNGLQGGRVFLDYPSVLGTQNIMMAACLARGETVIVNAGTEPEIQGLAQLLTLMGAKIRGAGTQTIEVTGVPRLHGAQHRIMPDRIESGTFALAAAISGGDVDVEDAPSQYLDSLLAKLRAAGAEVQARDGGIRVCRSSPLRSVNFQALPYPGLPTDLQAPLSAVLTQAEGVSIVHERVFDNRMLYVGELRKLGAEIVSAGSVSIVSGPRRLHGGRVRALDVRAGAAVVLAGLVAEGETFVEDIYHLDRGYENLDTKLQSLGARIERVQPGKD